MQSRQRSRTTLSSSRRRLRTTTTSSKTQDDDDQQQDASGSGGPGSRSIYLRGPASLPQRPILRDRRPLIRPDGERYVTLCSSFLFILCVQNHNTGSRSIYLRGPASLPQRPILRDRRPLIRPDGERYVTLCSSFLFILCVQNHNIN